MQCSATYSWGMEHAVANQPCSRCHASDLVRLSTLKNWHYHTLQPSLSRCTMYDCVCRLCMAVGDRCDFLLVQAAASMLARTLTWQPGTHCGAAATCPAQQRRAGSAGTAPTPRPACRRCAAAAMRAGCCCKTPRGCPAATRTRPKGCLDGCQGCPGESPCPAAAAKLWATAQAQH